MWRLSSIQILLLATLYCLGSTVQVRALDENPNDVHLNKDSFNDLGSASRAVCGAPFVAVGDQCLYLADEFTLTQLESRDICQSMGGDLMAIHNGTQLKNLIDYLSENGYSSQRFWIDGSDAVEEGNWRYASGLPVPMGTPFWYASETKQQPDNYGTVESCLTVEWDYTYLLNDRNCDNRYSHICEQSVQEIHEAKISPPVSDYCPQLYVQIDDACVAFILWAEESWVDARQTCHSLAGELAIIEDIELMRSIIVYIHQEEIQAHSFWLGGSDREAENVWMWENGIPVTVGQPFWGPEEPEGGSSENCLAMNTEGYHFFRDKSCDLLLTPMCIIN